MKAFLQKVVALLKEFDYSSKGLHDINKTPKDEFINHIHSRSEY